MLTPYLAVALLAALAAIVGLVIKGEACRIVRRKLALHSVWMRARVRTQRSELRALRDSGGGI